jgi:hypothetical protein
MRPHCTFFVLHIQYLIRHGPHRKHRVLQFFYCYVCILCRWNVFTEQLPSNSTVDTQTGRLSHKPAFIFQNKEIRLKNMEYIPNKKVKLSLYQAMEAHRVVRR